MFAKRLFLKFHYKIFYEIPIVHTLYSMIRGRDSFLFYKMTQSFMPYRSYLSDSKLNLIIPPIDKSFQPDCLLPFKSALLKVDKKMSLLSAKFTSLLAHNSHIYYPSTANPWRQIVTPPPPGPLLLIITVQFYCQTLKENKRLISIYRVSAVKHIPGVKKKKFF